MHALVDTHCHLDATAFSGDRAHVIASARQAGVCWLVVPAVERANFDTVRALCAVQPGCVPAYGIHPLYVDRAIDEDLELLRSYLDSSRPVAVGEIGLDFFVKDSDPALQERYFVAQLKLARDFDLPVILHVRRAVDAVLKHLRRIRVPGGIAHAFNGSRQQAEAFMKLGFKLGFGGAMTWPRALRIRDLAATLPLEAIVLETDAPDIPPVWLGHAGRNAPTELPAIATTLATLRGMKVSEVADITTKNAQDALPGIMSYAHDLK